MKTYTTRYKLYSNNNLNNIYATFPARTLRNTFIIQRHVIVFIKKKNTICYIVCIMSYIKSDLRIVVINGKKR